MDLDSVVCRRKAQFPASRNTRNVSRDNIIPAMSLATFCVACDKLEHVLFSCDACFGPSVACVACIRLETGLKVYMYSRV